MKYSKFAKQFVAFFLMFVLLAGVAPVSSAERSYEKISLTELMKMFDGRVKKPKESSILDEPESAVVKSKNGNMIYILSAPKTGKTLFEAKEGAAVTIYARQNGYALGIVDGTPIGGWMNEKYMLLVEKELAKDPEDTGSDQQKIDSLIAKGVQYELGDGEKQDYLKAEECYKHAIGLGSAEAKARLAVLYIKDCTYYHRMTAYEGLFGDPVFDKNKIADPIKLLLEAAETDDPVALLLLGNVIDDNSRNESFNDICGIIYWYNSDYNNYYEEDYERFREKYGLDTALEYYKRAYNSGNRVALKYINNTYYSDLIDRIGSQEEIEEAKNWINKKAGEKNPQALYLLGCFYKDEDIKRAEEYFELGEAAATEQNDADVLVLLANEKLREKESSETDYSDILPLFKKASEIGDSSTIVDMIDSFYGDYLEGGYIENKGQYDIVKDLVSMAYSRCNAVDLLDLGVHLHHGVCYTDLHGYDIALLSAECSLLAAEKGNVAALEELSCVLQECCVYLWDEWKNSDSPERMFKVILEAAENNTFPKTTCGDCDWTIVWIYKYGIGTKKDLKKAEYWRGIIEQWEEEKEQQ